MAGTSARGTTDVSATVSVAPALGAPDKASDATGDSASNGMAAGPFDGAVLADEECATDRASEGAQLAALDGDKNSIDDEQADDADAGADAVAAGGTALIGASLISDGSLTRPVKRERTQAVHSPNWEQLSTSSSSSSSAEPQRLHG